jgi:starvation-inducible outer membrane lipoprotein
VRLKLNKATFLALLAASFMLVSCLPYPSTLKVESKCSSKMSVGFQQITKHYIPEERILQESISK